MDAITRIQKRNLDIRKRYLSGRETLRGLGNHYGISQERVRRILKDYGIDNSNVAGLRKFQKDQRDKCQIS